MSQTKQSSFFEALTNVAIGFLVTLVFSPAIYWMCGVHMHYGQMGTVTVLFTVLSIARGYVVRRWFNRKER